MAMNRPFTQAVRSKTGPAAKAYGKALWEGAQLPAKYAQAVYKPVIPALSKYGDISAAFAQPLVDMPGFLRQRFGASVGDVLAEGYHPAGAFLPEAMQESLARFSGDVTDVMTSPVSWLGGIGAKRLAGASMGLGTRLIPPTGKVVGGRAVMRSGAVVPWLSRMLGTEMAFPIRLPESVAVLGPLASQAANALYGSPKAKAKAKKSEPGEPGEPIQAETEEEKAQSQVKSDDEIAAMIAANSMSIEQFREQLKSMEEVRGNQRKKPFRIKIKPFEGGGKTIGGRGGGVVNFPRQTGRFQAPQAIAAPYLSELRASRAVQ